MINGWVAAALALGQVVVAWTGPGSTPVRVAGACLGAGLFALAWRHRRPLVVVLLVAAIVVPHTALQPDGGNPAPAFVALMLATYSLGAGLRGPRLWAGLAVAVAAVVSAQALAAPAGYSRAQALAFLVPTLVLVPALVGRAARWRSSILTRLGDVCSQLSSTHEEWLATQLEQRRLAIADQVDAVVLRGLDNLRENDLAEGLPAIAAVESSARATLVEVRHLLASLGSPDERRGLPESVGAQPLRDRVRRVLATAPQASGAAVTSRNRWALPSPAEVDIALAGLAAFLAAGSVTQAAREPALSPSLRLLAVVVAVAASTAVAVCRRWPVAAGAVTVVALTAGSAAGTTHDPLAGFAVVGLLAAVPATVGALRGRWSSLGGLLVCAATAVALPAVNPGATWRIGDVAPALGIAAACWAGGRALSAQTRLMTSLAEAVARLDAERQALSESMVGVERARVALDLHDAVAHSLTTIVLQAGATRRAWDVDPTLAREHLRDLERAIDAALVELRPMVVWLHLAAERPGASLSDLAELALGASRAGLLVEVSVPDAEQAGLVPQTVASHAYRIVQEAITNAARHAPGSRVTLDVSVASGCLLIDVVNGPAASANDAGAVPGAGRGLDGMRQRAGLCGGRFTSGSTPDAGYAVRASLPIGHAS